MSQAHFTVTEPVPQAARSGYPFLSSILDGIEDSELLNALQQGRVTGRPGYSARSLWRAWLSKYILRIRFNVELVERLKGSSKLRQVCGFIDDIVPSESTLCRFFKRLIDYQPLVDQCLVDVTDQIAHKLPNFGKVLATDSTVFETYGNPDRKTKQGDPSGDMDARWGHKNSVKTINKDKVEWCFGYRIHAVADSLYGIPIGFILTPANENDSPLLPRVMRKIQSEHKWLKPRFLIADKGYDATSNYTFLHKRKIVPVINLRAPSHTDLHKGIYTPHKGSPTCQGLEEMTYLRTDPDTGHLFRCPPEGCPLKSQKGVHYCADEVWEDPDNEPRIVGKLPRASERWKALYKLRWHIERIFRSMKHSRLLERHCFRGMRKNLLHATLSMLTYSATALARLKAGDGRRMRVMRVNAA